MDEAGDTASPSSMLCVPPWADSKESLRSSLTDSWMAGVALRRKRRLSLGREVLFLTVFGEAAGEDGNAGRRGAEGRELQRSCGEGEAVVGLVVGVEWSPRVDRRRNKSAGRKRAIHLDPFQLIPPKVSGGRGLKRVDPSCTEACFQQGNP